MSTWMLYGASGYAGTLIAREAVRQGLRPILAGRSAAKLEPLARELGLEIAVFSLDTPSVIAEHLAGVEVLLNTSGPFKRTAQPLVTACLRSGTHYLDIAGEVPEFEALAARSEEAQKAEVMLLPGVGFGIVPTDCLAAHLARRLPSATKLTLAFHSTGGVSAGTAETVIEDLPRGGYVRRDGRLVPVAAGIEQRSIDFGRGPVATLSNPWRGDISTAYYTTNIPSIDVFTVIPSPLSVLMRASRFIGPLLGTSFVQRLLKRQAQTQGVGPTDAERATGRTYIWGEVTDRANRRAIARLEGPDAYDFTSMTAIMSIQRVLSGESKVGFQTPANLFGSDAIVALPSVIRTDC